MFEAGFWNSDGGSGPECYISILASYTITAKLISTPNKYVRCLISKTRRGVHVLIHVIKSIFVGESVQYTEQYHLFQDLTSAYGCNTLYYGTIDSCVVIGHEFEATQQVHYWHCPYTG